MENLKEEFWIVDTEAENQIRDVIGDSRFYTIHLPD